MDFNIGAQGTSTKNYVKKNLSLYTKDTPYIVYNYLTKKYDVFASKEDMENGKQPFTTLETTVGEYDTDTSLGVNNNGKPYDYKGDAFDKYFMLAADFATVDAQPKNMYFVYDTECDSEYINTHKDTLSEIDEMLI